ncbi:FecR family protein [Comamonas composti]|uniref:FecR family protein n=1 Tax=Comamonas composti TaxID=408558 RepID=UPI000A0425EB|nr:FecR domain-containing protein [Comamonas composti]
MPHASSTLQFRLSSSLSICTLLVLGLSVGGTAHAQITPQPLNSQTDGEVIAHRISPGDTLSQLADRYLGDHQLWPLLQQSNNNVNPYRLKPGSALTVPMRLLHMAMASVEFVQGDAHATRSSIEANALPVSAEPLHKGQSLQEGDRLRLAENAFVAIRLADGSLVRIQSESDLQLRQMRQKGRAGNLESVLDLRSGSVEVSSPPMRNPPPRRLEVRTPAATTSVRGTHFSVHANPSGTTSATVDKGLVLVSSDKAEHKQALLRPGLQLVVAANGHLESPRHMLTAPDLSNWPSLTEDSQWLSLPLPSVEGAVAYQVQLAQDEELSTVLRSDVFKTSPIRFTDIDDGEYLLSVRGLDTQGIPGQPSHRKIRVKAHPIAPLYEAPVAGATIGIGESGLRCTKVAQASRYRIQVAAAGGAQSFVPLIDVSDLTDCELAASALGQLPAGDYLWRTASLRKLADGSFDQGPFATPQAMRLASVPSSALQFSEAQDHIYWNGEASHSYRVMVATNAEFSSLLVDTWVDKPQWRTANLPSNQYFLRLQVKDGNGLVSAPSPAYTFQVGDWIVSSDGQRWNTGSGEILQRQ